MKYLLSNLKYIFFHSHNLDASKTLHRTDYYKWATRGAVGFTPDESRTLLMFGNSRTKRQVLFVLGRHLKSSMCIWHLLPPCRFNHYRLSITPKSILYSKRQWTYPCEFSGRGASKVLKIYLAFSEKKKKRIQDLLSVSTSYKHICFLTVLWKNKKNKKKIKCKNHPAAFILTL